MPKRFYTYTEDELYDNYEFKIIKRALMREYPWIKDVVVHPEDLKLYDTIFLRFIIDPIELGEQMGWTPNPWVVKAHKEDKEYDAPFISLFFIDLHGNDTGELKNDMLSLIKGIRRSPALPSELKLKDGGSRDILLGSFIMNPGKPPYF